MRFTKSLAIALIVGMPAVASAGEPIAAALSATFFKCDQNCALTPSTIAVAAATGDTVTAASVANITGDNPSAGALASGNEETNVEASVVADGSIYETFVVIKKK